LFVAVIYCSLKKQNFGSWMAALKLLLIVSFYRFLIKKCNCTADKRLNWHWYLPTAWSKHGRGSCLFLSKPYTDVPAWTHVKLINKHVA